MNYEALEGTIKNRLIELPDGNLKDAYKRLDKSDNVRFVDTLINVMSESKPEIKSELRMYLFRHIDPGNRMYIEQQLNVKVNV